MTLKGRTALNSFIGIKQDREEDQCGFYSRLLLGFLMLSLQLPPGPHSIARAKKGSIRHICFHVMPRIFQDTEFHISTPLILLAHLLLWNRKSSFLIQNTRPPCQSRQSDQHLVGLVLGPVRGPSWAGRLLSSHSMPPGASRPLRIQLQRMREEPAWECGQHPDPRAEPTGTLAWRRDREGKKQRGLPERCRRIDLIFGCL